MGDVYLIRSYFDEDSGRNCWRVEDGTQTVFAGGRERDCREWVENQGFVQRVEMQGGTRIERTNEFVPGVVDRAAKDAELERRRQEIVDLPDANEQRVTDPEVGEQHTVTRSPANPALRQRDQVLSGALRTMEEHGDSFRSKLDFEQLERHLRFEDLFGLNRNYVRAVGSEHYRSAWWKLAAAGGQAGACDFTSSERAAIDEWRQAEHQRTMAEGTGPAGGYGVPFSLDPSINLVSDGSSNPIRRLAQVTQIPGYELRLVNTTGATVTYEQELTEVTASPPPLTQPVVYAQKWQGFVDFSIEVGQDYTNLQGELSRLLGDARDQTEAAKFWSGSVGGYEPDGVITGLIAAGTATNRVGVDAVGFHAGGSAHTVGWYDLRQAIPPRFQPGSYVVAHRNTFDLAYRAIGSDSPEPPVLPDRAGPLLGTPKEEWSAIDHGTAVGQKVAVQGDFYNGYRIAERLGINIEFLPQLLGSNRLPNGSRGLYAYGRNGGTVATPEALRWLELTS